MQDRNGKIVGKYRIRRLLGRGGTGTVYLATDSELDREVALKQLHPELSQSSVHVEHFRREAKLLARIRHPHIVPVHALLREESTLYIDMAYIQGRSLRQLLSEEVLSSDSAARLIRQVLAALAACHAVDIVHCDLKPSNILIDVRGDANLVDFGWASLTSVPEVSNGGAPSLRETHFIGTPAYAPPETWKTGTPTACWDLYAVGVVAGEMLLGFPPAPGKNLSALLESNSRIPHAYGCWIARMMAQDPSERFSSADEALQALESIVETRDVEAARSMTEETIVQRREAPIQTGWMDTLPSSVKMALVLATCCVLIWLALKSGLGADFPSEGATPLPLSGDPDNILVVNRAIFFSATLGWSDRAVLRYNLDSQDFQTLIPASEVRGRDVFIHPFPNGSGRALTLLRGGEDAPRLWTLPDKGVATPLDVDGLQPGSKVNFVDYHSELLVTIQNQSTKEYFYNLTDGTETSTRLIWKSAPDLQSGPGIRSFAPIDDRVFIGTNTASGGLWRFTGDSEDSYPILKIGNGPTTGLVSWKGLVWAIVNTSDFGGELWQTDGTEGGTRLFLDLRSGPESAFQYDRDPGLLVVGDWLVFAARTDDIGLELWRTDGTKDGTSLIRDIAPGAADSNPYQWTLFQGRLYFTAMTRESGRELWVTDGTPEGTRMIADIKPGNQSGEPYSLCASDVGLFFSADDGVHGEELWLLQHADAAPVLVDDLYDGAEGSEPYKTQAVDGGVVFAATTPAVGRELFFSDGSKAGTRVLLDVGRESGEPQDTSTDAYNGPRLCTIESPEFGVELGICRGQDDSPELLLDIVPGPEGSHPSNFVTLGGKAYFSADDKVNGRELWVTDFTPSGTHVVADVNFRELSSNPREIMCVDGALYFVAENRDRGTELWRLDEPNRRAIALETVQGKASSNPHAFQRSGKMLIFQADDEHGKRYSWQVGADMERPIRLDEAPTEGDGSQ